MRNLSSVFVILAQNGTSTEAYIASVVSLVTRTILITYSLLVGVIGIPGNILAISILRRKALHQSFLSSYLIWLAILNISALMIGMSRLFMMGLLDFNYRQISPEICFVHTWMTMTAVNICNWHLVLITFGRWLYLRYPNKSAKIFKGWRMYFSIFLTLVAAGCLQGFFVFHGVSFEEFRHQFQRNLCLYGTGFGSTLTVQMVVCFIPLACLIIFSFLIYFDVKVKSRGASLGTSMLHQNRRAARDKNLALLLFVINVQFMVTNVPIAAVYLFVDFTFDKKYVIDLELSKFAVAIGRMLLYGGYATNCIIYCLFGSRFRTEIVKYLFDKGLCPRNFQRDTAQAVRSAWTSYVEPSGKHTSEATVNQQVESVDRDIQSLDVSNKQTPSYGSAMQK